MVQYRRSFLPGGTFFFTVTMADRRLKLLVEYVGLLRRAFTAAHQERPFEIDAIAVLPDHLHAILTLPQGDADFPGRWKRIKGHFSSALLIAGVRLPRRSNGELALWQRRYWEHTIRDEGDLERYRLHPFQSGQARPRSEGTRLASLVVPSIRASGAASRGLGG